MGRTFTALCAWGLALYFAFLTWMVPPPLPTPGATILSENQHILRLKPDRYFQGMAVANGNPITYRIHPSNAASSASRSSKVFVVVGVLSSTAYRDRRDAIRASWGNKYVDPSKGDESKVLFLMAGSWLNISQEFAQQGDLLWIDYPDEYLKVTWKVICFLQVAALHFPQHYALKTDDDSVVQLSRIEQRLLEPPKIHYWGECSHNAQVIRTNKNQFRTSYKSFPEPKYPLYAQGAGYLLSPPMVRCMAKASQITPVIERIEDVNSGILARTCRASCLGEMRVTQHNIASQRFFIWHHVYSNLTTKETSSNKNGRKPTVKRMKLTGKIKRIGVKKYIGHPNQLTGR